MKKVIFYVSLIILLGLNSACAPDTQQTAPIAQDPDDWPPAQDCGDRFSQDGKAAAQVPSCDNVQPQVYLGLVAPAQTDADNKAGLRCPNRCPAQHVSWQGNNQSCVNNTAKLVVTGNYRCP